MSSVNRCSRSERKHEEGKTAAEGSSYIGDHRSTALVQPICFAKSTSLCGITSHTRCSHQTAWWLTELNSWTETGRCSPFILCLFSWFCTFIYFPFSINGLDCKVSYPMKQKNRRAELKNISKAFSSFGQSFNHINQY